MTHPLCVRAGVAAILASLMLMLAATATSPPPTAAPSAPAERPTTVIPAPRDADWWVQRNEAINARAREGGATLAFLGDSITQGWESEGAEIWKQHYAQHNALNLGIGGDRTQNLLWRLNNGLLDALTQQEHPNNLKAIVLMIGTNNSNGKDNSAEEIAAGITAIVRTLREKIPNTKILLLAIFPRGGQPNAQREKNGKASELASKTADGTMTHYLDIGGKFLGENGSLSKEIMPDALHLSPRGYEIWAEAIKDKLAELMK